MKIKSLALALLMTAAIIACKKKEDPVEEPEPTPTPTPVAQDTTRPVITLNGADSSVVILNVVYTDPGATAADNKDGDISANIVTSGSVNHNATGKYIMLYNVKDAANNAAFQKRRVVIVANEGDYLSGQYISSPNCGATPTSGGPVNINASTTKNKELVFSSNIPGNYTGINPVLIVNGSNVSVPQIVNGQNSFQATGTIASDKKSITLSYTAATSSPMTGTLECTTIFTRQ